MTRPLAYHHATWLRGNVQRFLESYAVADKGVCVCVCVCARARARGDRRIGCGARAPGVGGCAAERAGCSCVLLVYSACVLLGCFPGVTRVLLVCCYVFSVALVFLAHQGTPPGAVHAVSVVPPRRCALLHLGLEHPGFSRPAFLYPLLSSLLRTSSPLRPRLARRMLRPRVSTLSLPCLCPPLPCLYPVSLPGSLSTAMKELVTLPPSLALAMSL